jgi:hypothetical protein
VAALKGVVVVAAVGVGALAAVGCLLAALFEVQGFGRPRDAEPRTGYLVELAVGFVASVAIPALLARWLFPRGGPALYLIAGVIAVGGVLLILGISLRG